MKIYDVEVTIRTKMSIWIDDESGETIEEDLHRLVEYSMDESEINKEIVGDPVIHMDTLKLQEEVSTEEIERRLSITSFEGDF